MSHHLDSSIAPMKSWKQVMKNLTLSAGTLVLCAGVSLAGSPPASTFSGEIMDSACAAMGSHDKMMQAHDNIKTARACTLGCVKNGAKFVLYDGSTKTVYQLDDQNAASIYPGEAVKVTGTLDASTHTIHVEKIETRS